MYEIQWLLISPQNWYTFEIAGKVPISSFKPDINHWTNIKYILLITRRSEFMIPIPHARAIFCSILQLSKSVVRGSVCWIVINTSTGSLEIILWSGVADITTEWWIKVNNHTLHFPLKSSYYFLRGILSLSYRADSLVKHGNDL